MSVTDPDFVAVSTDIPWMLMIRRQVGSLQLLTSLRSSVDAAYSQTTVSGLPLAVYVSRVVFYLLSFVTLLIVKTNNIDVFMWFISQQNIFYILLM